MKVIKGIFKFIWFIFRLILTIVLILVILFVSKSVMYKMEYAKYNETGIMKNGNLCISHMSEGGGGRADKYYISDKNVLQETDDFWLSNGISFSTKDSVFGKVYKPINSGTSDIYVAYSTFGGDPIKYFEVYHVEVDKNLNITYNMEIISKEQFEENTGAKDNYGWYS